MIITIPGKPLGKQRARTLKSGRSYTPEQTVNYETLVKMCYVDQMGDNFGEQQLKMGVVAYYPIPQKTSKLKLAMMRTGELRPIVKPDADNVCKIVTDAISGIAYHDDKQIVTLVFDKYYGDIPRVELEIAVSKLQ